jgi:hypothetical protein
LNKNSGKKDSEKRTPVRPNLWNINNGCPIEPIHIWHKQRRKEKRQNNPSKRNKESIIPIVQTFSEIKK